MPLAELAFRRQSWRRPYRVLNALCMDGKRRNVTITSELSGSGRATGFVSVQGHSVTGWVQEAGWPTTDWSFTADAQKKWGHLLEDTSCPEDPDGVHHIGCNCEY